MSSKVASVADMQVAQGAKVRKSETPCAVVESTVAGSKRRVSLTLQSEFSGDKAAYWLRFSHTDDALVTHMTGLGWRYVDTRMGWWAYVTDNSTKYVKELKLHTGSASAPKTTTPANVTSAPKTKPVESKVTPVAAPKQPPVSKLADWSKEKLIANIRTRMADIEILLVELESRK